MFKRLRFKSVGRPFATEDAMATEQISERILSAKASLDLPQSCLFFTTHKCASSFAQRLFNVITAGTAYRVVDYPTEMSRLGDDFSDEIANLSLLNQCHRQMFRSRGEVYAPLRHEINFPDMQSFKHIYFLRDPRDVLVSSFFSYAFTHVRPESQAARVLFDAYREEIKQEGIDAYSLRAARDWLLPLLLHYKEVQIQADYCLCLTYDDYINDTVGFIEKIAEYLEVDLPEGRARSLAEEASPVQSTVQADAHKRSGKSGQFADELKPATIAELNDLFADQLDYWKLGQT